MGQDTNQQLGHNARCGALLRKQDEIIDIHQKLNVVKRKHIGENKQKHFWRNMLRRE